MLFRKKHFLVGITTDNFDMLRISIPWLRRFSNKFVLVIHNENPEKKLTKSTIKRLGWCGELHIINSEVQTDKITATNTIVDFVKQSLPHIQWMTFIDNGDVFLSCNIPTVQKNIFAIVQNATTISNNVSEFLKINKNWINNADCGVTGPHFDFNGTWIRFEYLCEFMDFLIPLLPQASKIAKKLKHQFFMSPILWQGMNTFMHAMNPDCSALYMNQTNYVAVHLGNEYNTVADTSVNETATLQFNELFKYGIAQNMVAPEQ